MIECKGDLTEQSLEDLLVELDCHSKNEPLYISSNTVWFMPPSVDVKTYERTGNPAIDAGNIFKADK